jgi:glyoxylase-like metal-dependent hydrolase (beta-lactamase superfamily II)
VQWIHGAADCRRNSDPLIQVHQLDEATFVLRLSKCFSFEGNFMYLLFGEARAVLFDTGARPDSGRVDDVLPIRRIVDELVARWLADRGLATIGLVVAHTHSHGDHTFWDRHFVDRARTTVVPATLSGVQAFFRLPAWPAGSSRLELGGRTVTVFPIPGHEASHLAAYDPRTASLLTGDTLYPGVLTVRDWPAYRSSAARLALFARTHEISQVLGSHIEMTREPREAYPVGTTHQPEEHALPLGTDQVEEWHSACEAMGDTPRIEVHDHFVIRPLG